MATAKPNRDPVLGASVNSLSTANLAPGSHAKIETGTVAVAIWLADSPAPVVSRSCPETPTVGGAAFVMLDMPESANVTVAAIAGSRRGMAVCEWFIVRYPTYGSGRAKGKTTPAYPYA